MRNKSIYLALLVAMSLALSIFEMVIPLPIPMPGAKLGLSNIVITVTLVIFGLKEGLLVGVLKSLILMLVTGSVTSMFYSLAGAILSVLAMAASLRLWPRYISLIGISEIGAAAHNMAQISVAAIILANVRMFSYLPMLMGLGIFTGYFVGRSSIFIVDHLEKIMSRSKEWTDLR